jgi:phosphotransacetylase
VKSLNSDNHLGPILLGVNGAVQIVTASSKSRSIFNMAALAVADARFNKDLIITNERVK